jgi:hypothetical protein
VLNCLPVKNINNFLIQNIVNNWLSENYIFKILTSKILKDYFKKIFIFDC